MPYFGEPYAFLQNKNDSKWGAVEIPPVWDQKRHFQPADYDLLEKERLAARRFGHVRHNTYKNVLEPISSSLSYAPENDRLSKDIEATVRLDHATRLCKKKEILDSHKTARHHREKQAEAEREEEWKKAVGKETWMRYDHPHARVLANRTSVPYDPITLCYHDGYEGERAKYNDDAARWRATMRAMRIYRKMNGDKNYDVISWERIPSLPNPSKPNPPPSVFDKQQTMLKASQPSICKDVEIL